MNDIINTICIPTLNNPEGLHDTLVSLKEHTPPNYKVIVVDNSGGDGAVLEKTKPYINLLLTPDRNLGFAKSFNLGLLCSNTKYYTTANDDLFFYDPAWWDGIIETFNSAKNIGAVNPMSPRNPHRTGDVIEQYPFVRDFKPADIARIREIFGSSGVIDGVCTWCTVLDRRVMEEIGQKEGSPYGLAIMDELYYPGGGEDYDLNRRFGLQGWRIVSTRHSYVWHWWGKTKNNMPVPKDGRGSTNYQLIEQGYATMHKKWGKSYGTEDGQSLEGWDLIGSKGTKEPMNGMPFATLTDL
jgi:GT2 family glycosyltransferase